MKTPLNPFVVIFLISLFCGGCAMSKKNRTTFRANGVEIVIEEKTPSSPVGYGDEVLHVAGHSFHNLYSASYAFVPEWNSIIFLTHRDGGAYVLHVFSLDKKQDIAIEQDGFRVGRGLGHARTDSDACFVEKVEGDIAILVDRGYGGLGLTIENTYRLDRANKTLSHLESRKMRRGTSQPYP